MGHVSESILDPPMLFARVGDAGLAEGDSLDTWTVAARLGADGLLAVLNPGDKGDWVVGRARGRLRGRSATVPLQALWEAVGATSLDLALEVPDADAGAVVLEQAAARGLSGRLWACSADLETLGGLVAAGVRCLHSCDPESEGSGPEAHAAHLRRLGIDGALINEERATAGMVALMHRFGRLVVAVGANYRRTAGRALSNGADGVCGTDAEALADARAGRTPG